MIEARYRHHNALSEAARRHSGLPPNMPVLRPPPGARDIDPALEALSGDHKLVHPDAELTAVPLLPPPTLVAEPHDAVTPFEHPEADLDANPPEEVGEEPSNPGLGPLRPVAASDE